ncbi:MAG: nitroreductase family deazaflavin-dependent oxidoreductase [Dermatophilus congolensis]|nr:nitroreductase family deazaflavin-dependent oxidoreductase [Dermatophilus congolensis]
MTLTGEYQEPVTDWVREQLEAIDAAGDTRAVDMNGMAVVVFTVRGAKSGLLRRIPLMKVEHNGSYAAVASYGGAPKHPAWYHSMKANPQVDVQDGTETLERVARELEGAEREEWWERCVAAFPPYAEYATKTDRLIPVFICEPA